MRTYIVYTHTNKINGKVYVGMTSQSAEQRWKNGRGYHGMHFYRAIQKYGWDNFSHEVIADGLTRNEACQLEKQLISEHNATDPQHGYNCASGGDGGGMINKHHTAEAKDKIRVARIRDGFSEEHKAHISEAKRGTNHHFAKRVYQYTKDGTFVKAWDYMSLASKELGINKANIGETCNGKRKSAGGFIWTYEMR